MNTVDVILLIPLLYGLVMGLYRGVVKEVGSIVSVVVGIYVARYWATDFSAVLQKWFDCSETVALPLAYGLLFILCVVGVQTVAYLLSKLLQMVKLGWINRLLGGLFGTFKWVLILSVILNFIAMVSIFAPVLEKKSVQNSVLYRPIENVMGNVLPFIHFDGWKTEIGNLTND